MATGKEEGQLRDHTGCVLCLALTPDGRTLVSAGEDKIARVWDTDGGKVTARYRGHANGIDYVRVAPNGAWAATVAEGGKEIKLWATKDGAELTALKGHTDAITALDVTAGAAGLVTVAPKEPDVRLWSVVEKKAGNSFPGHPRTRGNDGVDRYQYEAQFLDGERYLATLGSDGTLRIWFLETGKEVRRIAAPGAHNLTAAGLDGGMLALVTDGKLAIVRVTTK